MSEWHTGVVQSGGWIAGVRLGAVEWDEQQSRSLQTKMNVVPRPQHGHSQRERERERER